MKKDIGYAVWLHEYGIFWFSARRTKRMCIKQFEDYDGWDWKRLYRIGYRVVKLTQLKKSKAK